MGIIKDAMKAGEQEEMYVENKEVIVDVKDEVISDEKIETKSTPYDFETNQSEVFKFLAGKTGREINSFEDLIKEKEIEKEIIKEKEVRKYSSKEAESYDKYFEETGRPFSDFVNLSKDVDSLPEDEVIISYLKAENPSMSDEILKKYFKASFDVPEALDPEDYSESEVKAREKEITIAEFARQQYINKAKQFHKDNKEKYLTPLEDHNKQREDAIKIGAEQWKQGMNSALNDVADINIDDFSFKFSNIDKYKDKLGSIENVLGSFKNENGEFDYKQLAQVVMIKDQMKDMLSAYGKSIEAKTLESQMKQKSNYSTPSTATETGIPTKASEAISDFKRHLNSLK